MCMLWDCVGEEEEPEATIFAGPMVEMGLTWKGRQGHLPKILYSPKDSVTALTLEPTSFSSLIWILSVMCVSGV